MTTFSDSILFIANGITQQSHSGDTISISRNLTVASPAVFTIATLAGGGTQFVEVNNSGVVSAVTKTGSGDVSGTWPSLTVNALQGNAVQSGTLGSANDGYVLTWINSDGQWEAKPVSTTTSGIQNFQTITTDTQAVKGTLYFWNGSAGGTLTAPAAAGSVDGDTFGVCDISDSLDVNPLLVVSQDTGFGMQNPLQGQNWVNSLALFTNIVTVIWVYSSVWQGWELLSTSSALGRGMNTLGPGTTNTTLYNNQICVVNPSIASSVLTLNTQNVLADSLGAGNDGYGTQVSVKIGYTFGSGASVVVTNTEGLLLEDPQNPGTYSGSVNLVNFGQCVTWVYDYSNRWSILSNFDISSSGSSVTMGGDVTGNSSSATVIKVNGVSYPATPSTNTVPVVTGSNTVTYQQITDAQISASANVSVSKLAPGTATQFLLSNATPTATWTTMSGDGYLSATGALTIVSLSGESNEVIVNIPNFVFQNSVVFPEISQLNLASGNSATAGQPLSVIPQNGQNALSGTNNGGNGGNLLLSSGMGGTPTGGGTSGANGNVQIQLGASTLITYTANTETWATSFTPIITQTTTSSGSGAAFTVQAQSATGATNNGGNLVLAAGTSGSATAGNVQLQTAGTPRLTAGATGVITISNLSTGVVHADSSGNLTSSTIVNADVGAAANIAVSKLAAGTAAQILINSSAPTPTWTTVTGDTSITFAGATKVLAIQNEAVHADTLGPSTDGYILTWDNADGYWTARPAVTTSSVTLAGDVTGLSNANTVVKINGTSVPATPSANQVLVATSGTAATWAQIVDAYVSATAAIAGTKISPNFGSQNVTTSGNITTTSTGSITSNTTVTATTGVITNSVDTITGTTLNLGTSTATKVQIGKSGDLTEILGDLKVDGAETIVGTSTFQSAVTFDGNVTVADGYNFTVIGTTAGNYSINGATASSLTTNSGASLTITAGAASTWSTTAGALTLSGNAGINLQTNGTTIASTNINQFVFSKGIRRNVRTVTAGTTITATDDIISVGTLSGSATMVLPTSPTVGDAYSIKDKVGGASTNSIILDSGSGNKVDAAQTFVMDINYAAVELVCVATSPNQWAIV